MSNNILYNPYPPSRDQLYSYWEEAVDERIKKLIDEHNEIMEGESKLTFVDLYRMFEFQARREMTEEFENAEYSEYDF